MLEPAGFLIQSSTEMQSFSADASTSPHFASQAHQGCCSKLRVLPTQWEENVDGLTET